ncbi:MAG: hypothetical protein JSU06_04535 [Actinobacteria bacterium]|nr:hypothetical protein [Actinomycetota bacterium]
MVSTSLHLWQGPAQEVFAELELAHRAVRRLGRERRLLSRQIVYAYVTALSAQFQLYCRAVHTETAQALAASVPNPAVGRVLEARLINGRWLDRGNANVPNLGSDFGRFDLRFWDAVLEHQESNRSRKEKLEALIVWRNAIGHGDIAHKRAEDKLVPAEVGLAVCREWKDALGNLVASIDVVLAAQYENLGLSRAS